MNITTDTDVLIRAAVQDDPKESALAARVLREADRIVITLPSLREFVWVLVRGYKRSAADVAAALRRLIEGDKIAVDRPAVEAGLAVLEAGGDFADGIIAFEGRRLGGEVFATFDRKAAAPLGARGVRVDLLRGG